MNAMKAGWIRLATRLDALSVRERVIMAVSLAAALAAVVDVLVLSPQFAAQRALVDRQRAQAADLAQLRGTLTAPAVGDERAALLRTLAARRTALADLEARVAQQIGPDGQAPLPSLLARVLRRHGHLTLVALETPRPDPSATAGRREVTLRLAGTYADLTAFVAETERLLPALGWLEVAVDGRTQPAVLEARVWLPGDGT